VVAIENCGRCPLRNPRIRKCWSRSIGAGVLGLPRQTLKLCRDDRFRRNRRCRLNRLKSNRTCALPPGSELKLRNEGIEQKARNGLLQLRIVLAVRLFLPAWTFDYWQARIFPAVFSASVLAVTIYLTIKDPELLERRIHSGPRCRKAEEPKSHSKPRGDRICRGVRLSALDHRFAWSTVPNDGVAAGDILVPLGAHAHIFRVQRNTFTSATVEVWDEQKIISTGPYALVRHPMYVGALGMLLLIDVPVAFGSWWGPVAIIPVAVVMVSRLVEEERFLAKKLPGHSGYRNEGELPLAALYLVSPRASCPS
jgi:protein-S-isoprenylcysteine O-methyltransferase Ste14